MDLNKEITNTGSLEFSLETLSIRRFVERDGLEGDIHFFACTPLDGAKPFPIMMKTFDTIDKSENPSSPFDEERTTNFNNARRNTP